MTQRGSSQRLSAQDASFLYMERKESALHIGSIGVFEGQISYDQFVNNIRAKLHLIPRYQQIATPAPLQLVALRLHARERLLQLAHASAQRTDVGRRGGGDRLSLDHTVLSLIRFR